MSVARVENFLCGIDVDDDGRRMKLQALSQFVT